MKIYSLKVKINYDYMIIDMYSDTCIYTDDIYINTYISIIYLIYLLHVETNLLGRYMLNLDIAFWMEIRRCLFNVFILIRGKYLTRA